MSSPTSFTEPKESNLLKVLSGTFAETELKDLSQPIDESDCAEDYGYCSDSDLEDDNDAVKGETLKKTVTESAGKGTVIKVQDIAFITCVFSDTYCLILLTSDDLEDFRHFYFIYTPVPSNLRHLDRRRTASQGVPKSFLCRRTRYLDHHQSRSIVSQTRPAPFFVMITVGVTSPLVRHPSFERACLGQHQRWA